MKRYLVWYLHPATEEPALTNLGLFDSQHEAEEARHNWASGFEKSNGRRPDTFVLPEGQTRRPGLTNPLEQPLRDLLAKLDPCDPATLSQAIISARKALANLNPNINPTH